MNRPSAFTQIKWLAIFLAGFFTVSGFAEFAFVKRQVHQSNLAGLSESADQISKAVNYPHGTANPGEYNKAFIDSRDYFVVLSDGYLFDNGAGTKRIPRGLLPEAAFSGDEQSLYTGPVQYRSPIGEPWHVMAKRLTGGRVILGVSELDNFAQPDAMLLSNAAHFKGSVGEAAKVSRNKLDNYLHYAVLDDAGELVAGSGRLPLKTNPLALGALGFGAMEKTIGGAPYLLWVQPVYDEARRIGATIIVYQDVSPENRMLEEHLKFSVAIAGVSWIVLFLFGFRHWNKKEAEKRELREAFQNYFSPQVMEAILADPDKLNLGGERREVTILFSDIRAFTSLSENLPPQTLTHLLHEYFSEMTEAVLATDGILDKYIGDAVMAFWGAPIPQADQADRAVSTAIDMVRRLKKLHEKWKRTGHPQFDIGIGINLGVATVGNFGSTKRYDYTVIGDAVNSASRIEGLNKGYQSSIIISESTRNQLTLGIEVEDLGDVQVKGKEKPIRIFRVVGEA